MSEYREIVHIEKSGNIFPHFISDILKLKSVFFINIPWILDSKDLKTVFLSVQFLR